MKKRWMKTVIDTTRQDMPAMPFQRAVRRAVKTMPKPVVLKTA
ncbi:MAG: hypothetical protein NXH74_09125 [Rhodobacteraceae bacterium]|jgi:hypothetical protein|nr:hypothetical protein [Paracoccaceae bacterium]